MSFAPINSVSSYLPIEFYLPDDEDLAKDFISKRERLTADILNLKENANYELRELLTAQQWFSTVTPPATPRQRYGYRTTVDLVALNGGVAIPAGVTNLVLPANATVGIPAAIIGYTLPLPSHGSALAADGVSLFLNDPFVYVRFTSATNTISITNNYGANLTQCYFVLEYLKQ